MAVISRTVQQAFPKSAIFTLISQTSLLGSSFWPGTDRGKTFVRDINVKLNSASMSDLNIDHHTQVLF